MPANRLLRSLIRRRFLALMPILLGLALLGAGLAQDSRSAALPLTVTSITLPHPGFPFPVVTSTDPKDGETDVVYDPVISVEFSREMDPSTMSWASFYLTDSEGRSVLATRKYRTDRSAWYLYPVEPLEPGATYVATVTTEAKAENGTALVVPVTWSFTTVFFADVSLDNPYAVAISHLASSGIISGYADQSFRPGEPVKRMQFAKMIWPLTGPPPTVDDECPFGDVPSDLDPNDPLYPDHYIGAAYARGVIKGKTATTFAPYESITRYQLITMVVRVMQLYMPAMLQTPPPDYHSTWDPTLSPDHGENARVAEYNHLLSGIPIDSLSPWDPIPRGEVAQVIDNIGG